MRFNKWTLSLAAVAVLALTTSVKAQTLTNLTEVPNQINPIQFYSTALDWLTHINPTNDWTKIDLEIATGYKQVTGVGASSDLTVQYDIGRWNVGGWIQFSGVGSPINSGGLQGGYAVIQDGDVKLETNLRLGYGRQIFSTHGAFVVEPYVALTKLMTANTFSRIGISLPEDFKGSFNSTPTFFVEVGFGYLKALVVGK